MTTAPPRSLGPGPAAAVRLPLVAAVLTTLLLVLLGALADGAGGALGALVGSGLVVGAFTVGALTLGAVARTAPAASLLVALLTYTLTVMLLAVVLVGLSGSGALEETLHRGWLGGAVIACTLVWITAQIVAAMRSRQPLYDLPPDGEEASVR